jgi:O-antigen ligase
VAEKLNYRNSLIATFINPNVAAVYFGACTLIWLLLLANTVELSLGKQPQSVRQILSAALFNRPSPQTVFYSAALFVVLSAMFMTGSRAGLVISLLAICGAAATLYRRQLGARGLLLGFPAIAIAAVLVMFQIFGSRVNQRFDSEGLFDSGRWNAYLSSINIIKDHPWLGTGLGTFRWTFPAYRSGEISMIGIWEHAHSTTLELAVEMGIPFTMLVVVLVFVILWRGILTRKRDEILPLAAFWAAILGVLHSQVDFSLQVPGFSIVVFALVGMGLAQSASSRTILT